MVKTVKQLETKKKAETFFGLFFFFKRLLLSKSEIRLSRQTASQSTFICINGSKICLFQPLDVFFFSFPPSTLIN